MQAKSLIVYGSSRFLNTLYANDLNITNATVNNLTVTGTTNIAAGSATSASLQINNKGALYGYDSWLRINEQKQFSSGVYFGSNIVRTDGSFQIGSAGANILMNTSGATFKVPININGTTYKWTTDGNINANGITATNANINKGIFHNAVVEGTLYATHQEIDHVANLGGVFLVTPTVKCISSGNNKTLTSVTVTASSTTRTNSDGESITYNYSLQINDSAFSTASIGGNNWVQYGEIKISGNINGTVLGTCDGFIQSINTSTHVLTVAIKYNGDQTLATPSDISTVEDLNVMLKTVYDSSTSTHYPVGIWMKSRDVNGYSHISLYGGTSVDPTVRIGNLQGCPTINGQTPTGWGIFTNNGYFSGLIVSNSGKIGNFTISDALYSTAKAFGTTANNVYIGDDGISLGTTFKVTKAGELTTTSGYIASWNISSNSLATGTWGTDSSAMLCTGTSGSKSIGGSSSINGWVFTAGANFGVTKAGALYANSAHISGEITATSGTIGGASISNGVLQVTDANISGTISGTKITAGTLAVGALNSTSQSQVLNSEIEVGGRNLLSDTRAFGTIDTTGWPLVTNNLTLTTETYKGLTVKEYPSTTLSSGTKVLVEYILSASKATDVIQLGATYVCSFYAKGSGSFRTYFHISNPAVASWIASDGTTGTTSDGAKIWTLTTDWKRYWIAYTLSSTGTPGAKRLLLRHDYNASATLSAKLCGIKLELGNKATDWTPAPEDVDTSISNAAQTATNYLTQISGTTGISVHSEGDTSNFVNMNSNGVFVYKGGTQKAKFADTVTIGKPYVNGATDNESHMELDNQSLQLIDMDGNTYFHVQDLRDSDGEFEHTETFSTDGVTNEFRLAFTATDDNYTITYGGPGTISSKTIYQFTFSSAPPVGYSITVNYHSASDQAKGYTFGKFKEGECIGAYSIREGFETVANGSYSHAEGYRTKSDSFCHSEGYMSKAIGYNSHAEGHVTTASGALCHAEGYYTEAIGDNSHAEGNYTEAIGDNSHAEGIGSSAHANDSHAEGNNTNAYGECSHAEGYTTTANGDYSHTQNNYSVANSRSQTVIGEYNDIDTTGTASTRGTYSFIIGNGVDVINRSNAFTVDWNGNTVMAGALTTTGNINTSGTYQKGGSDFITTQSFDLGTISITAGTPGTASTTISKTITKTGYTPIAVKIRYVSTSVIGFNAFFSEGNASLYVQVIRRQSGASSPGYKAYADVTYIKS